MDIVTNNEMLLSVDQELLAEVPLERLEAEITGFASRLASATCTWLLWIAAYDRRGGWASWQAKSCAHWLNWQCGVAPRTAREHVFVAHKLVEFSAIRQAFANGELSYSKVRAVCRVVEPVNEDDLVEMAKLTTAAQLERICGKMPDPNAPDPAQDESVLWDFKFSSNCDGTATITITAPISEASTARAAVHAKTSEVIERNQTDDETKTDTIDRLGGMKQLRADTALAMISGEVDAVEEPQASVMVVADIEALTGTDEKAESTVDHQRVDPAVVQRLSCDSIVEAAVQGNDGTELGIGRASRIVPRRIRRLMLRRDHGMCQFPGCEAIHRLHAHHVIHWANGGETELANLISLCHFHHHSVHEGGWTINAKATGWSFIDPSGNHTVVPVLRLPTTKPLAKSIANKSGTAVPLSGLGEPCNANYVADILISNTALRNARSGDLQFEAD